MGTDINLNSFTTCSTEVNSVHYTTKCDVGDIGVHIASDIQAINQGSSRCCVGDRDITCRSSIAIEVDANSVSARCSVEAGSINRDRSVCKCSQTIDIQCESVVTSSSIASIVGSNIVECKIGIASRCDVDVHTVSSVHALSSIAKAGVGQADFGWSPYHSIVNQICIKIESGLSSTCCLDVIETIDDESTAYCAIVSQVDSQAIAVSDINVAQVNGRLTTTCEFNIDFTFASSDTTFVTGSGRTTDNCQSAEWGIRSDVQVECCSDTVNFEVDCVDVDCRCDHRVGHAINIVDGDT